MADIHGILNRRIWDFDDLRIALEEDSSSVESLNFEDETPLLRVLEDRDCTVMIVKLLIQYGAQVKRRTECGRYPLHSALSTSKDEPIIRVLLEAGADPHMLYFNRSTLCYAFEHSPIGVVRLLLDKGVSHSACKMHGGSVLHCAVNFPHPKLREDVLKLLLERKADVTKLGRWDQTIMCFALWGGVEVRLLKLLLNAGALLDSCTIHPSPLICATSSVSMRPLSVDVIKMLLDWGACPYKVDRRGCTALQLALWFGDCDIEVIKLLMDFPGMDVNKYHLLNYATRNQKCKASVLELLLQQGAQMDIIVLNGDMPIHSAVRFCSPDVIKLLLQNGCSVVARNQSGETPLILTLRWRNESSILMALFLAGARVGNCPFELLEMALEYYEKERFYDTEDSFKLLVKFCLLENPNMDIELWMMLMPDRRYPCHDFPIFVRDCLKEMQQMNQDHGSVPSNFMMGNFCANSGYVNQLLKVKPDIGAYRMFFDIITARVGTPWMTSRLQELRVYATKQDSSSSCEDKKVFLNYESVRAIAKFLSAEDLLRFIMAYHQVQ